MSIKNTYLTTTTKYLDTPQKAAASLITIFSIGSSPINSYESDGCDVTISAFLTPNGISVNSDILTSVKYVLLKSSFNFYPIIWKIKVSYFIFEPWISNYYF